MIKIKDYTEPDEFEDPNDKSLFKHPFRLLITGPSGCGKTNFLLNLIYDVSKFDALYVCAKDIEEPKYSKLEDRFTQFDDLSEDDIKTCKRLNKKDKYRLLEEYHKYKKASQFASDLDDFITVDELDMYMKNLVIFDDCITTKDQSKIIDFFIRGRKKNASIIYISQSYYDTPKAIRKNCNYFIFFKLQDRDLKQIVREIDSSINEDITSKLQSGYGHFMIIDLKNPNERYKFN